MVPLAPRPLAPRLRPAFLGLAMTARARAKLYEMNSNVRFRGVLHLCRGEGARGGRRRWWWGTVGVFSSSARFLTLGARHVFLFCLSQPTHPATARPATPASPSLYCKRETVPRVVVEVGCFVWQGWVQGGFLFFWQGLGFLCLPPAVSSGQPCPKPLCNPQPPRRGCCAAECLQEVA